MKRIIIVGAGGHGREMEDLIQAINSVAGTWDIVGIVDDAPSPENRDRVARLGQRFIGGLNDLFGESPGHFVIGIGNGQHRAAIDQQLVLKGWEPAVLVHPAAYVGADVALGPGSVICAGVTATTNISLGRHVHVNRNATLGHDSYLEDYVTVNPLAAISGNVRIGTMTMIGTTAAILQNLSVGARSTVGAGAVVTKDVGDDVIVKGIPAR
ncbi:acetyltransferase [Nostocoides jenkinsii]|uniref:Putative acetyl transferase protein n=1 Tax=Nostocoides jenkinsii Ben 74 TaxID=1193518 RepID=A0A077MBJ3_9MICO|nr:acetyltransferase [Tetrasphaera jenkinsii]CCI52023.1 putative acetyl transferase protein [Tetrasphaera jenkinsii Ben 74]